LVLTDEFGNSAEAQQNISVVADRLPTADFTSSSWEGVLPLTVQLTDTSLLGDAEIVSWYWEFGTGESSNLQIPSYTYTQSGDYTVSLTVIDSKGLPSTQTYTIRVQAPSLHARFHMSQSVLPVGGGTINFSDTSYGKPVVAWEWYVDGIFFSAEQNPSYTFLTNGEYTIRLIVTADDGSTDIAERTLRVLDVNEFLSQFSVAPS
ncbi:MAG TPA: PKD domain-containing protein, partial [Aggregatilineales bacterium]|nr:PKD domain-containing protein [Aggregatilineales bacterium]